MFKQSGNKISQKPCVRVLLQQERSIVQTVSQKSLKNSWIINWEVNEGKYDLNQSS